MIDFTGILTAAVGGSSSCGCTCASNWVNPAGWSGGGGPVAIMHFEDTACIAFNGGTEAQIKVPAHVSIDCDGW